MLPPGEVRIGKLVSGGQTGVDRAALDAALELKIPAGGWCPRGRRTEDGRLDEIYPLAETPEDNYEQRTEWNVRDSDGTLIVTKGATLGGGTAFTRELALSMRKPHLVVDLDSKPDLTPVLDWLKRFKIVTLNVAGPRESSHPGIYLDAKIFLMEILAHAS